MREILRLNVIKYIYITGLPAELSADLSKVTNHVEQAKKTIQNLETALAKGKAIEEEKQGWISGENYVPEEEISMIQQKSEQKIEEAKTLRSLIEKFKQDPGFMTQDEIQTISDALLSHFGKN